MWALIVISAVGFVLIAQAQWQVASGMTEAESRLGAANDRAKLAAEREKYADTLPAFSAETERCMELHDAAREAS